MSRPLEELAHATQGKAEREARAWFADDMLLYPENPGESIYNVVGTSKKFQLNSQMQK